MLVTGVEGGAVPGQEATEAGSGHAPPLSLRQPAGRGLG